ncbi:MAG: HAD-IIB family hydrolase [Myxococcales bacterium]|nr:MAG: HAD-IIB family hydrolase [Myxococcales bacterium]
MSLLLILLLLLSVSCAPSKSSDIGSGGWAQSADTAGCFFSFNSEKSYLLSGIFRRPLRETVDMTVNWFKGLFQPQDSFQISFSFHHTDDGAAQGTETTLNVNNGEQCILDLRRVVQRYIESKMNPCELADLGASGVVSSRDFTQTVLNLLLRMLIEEQVGDGALAEDIAADIETAQAVLAEQSCSGAPLDRPGLQTLASNMQSYAGDSGKQIIFLLDYDGTLAPIVALPQLAAPDEELLALLPQVADRSSETHVVSGRGQADLQDWLGSLPIGLHAEHGLLSSNIPTSGQARQWVVDPRLPEERIEEIKQERDRVIRPILESAINDPALYVDGASPLWTDPATGKQYPALLIEEKYISLVLHFRAAEEVLGRDLEAWADGWREQLETAIAANNLPLVVTGQPADKNREVQIDKDAIGIADVQIHKGKIANGVTEHFDLSKPTLIIAAGDSGTDEDLFEAIHSIEEANEAVESYTIHVGALKEGVSTAARFIVDSPAEIRYLLQQFVN